MQSIHTCYILFMQNEATNKTHTHTSTYTPKHAQTKIKHHLTDYTRLRQWKWTSPVKGAVIFPPPANRAFSLLSEDDFRDFLLLLFENTHSNTHKRHHHAAWKVKHNNKYAYRHNQSPIVVVVILWATHMFHRSISVCECSLCYIYIVCWPTWQCFTVPISSMCVYGKIYAHISHIVRRCWWIICGVTG